MSVNTVLETLSAIALKYEGHKVIIDEASSSFGYLGIAQAGSDTSSAAWRIFRVYRQGAVYTTETAPGEGYDNVWDDRTTYFATVPLNNSYSVEFDGVNDSVDCGNNYTFEISQAFSISLWVKPNNLAATRCLISKASNDVNVWGYNIQHLITTGKIQVQMRTPTASPLYAFTTALTAGVWQHIVMTYSGGSNINGVRTYKDSVIGDTPGSSALTGTFTNAASFVIGARNTAFPFSGFIDEVSVWDKELSQSEVTEIYNSGQPGDLADHSAFNNLNSWWRMGDGSTYPLIVDEVGANDATMLNMISGSIVGDVP